MHGKRNRKAASLADRFWPKVDKSGECWLWTASLGTSGYGQISYGRRGSRPVQTHRVAWELTFGPIPDGLHVCHRCDVKRCVRPEHLFLGTISDNVRDMHAKGRGAPASSKARGERVSLAKLTASDVIAIRAAYSPTLANSYQLAKLFGVHASTIQHIVRRDTWRHVS